MEKTMKTILAFLMSATLACFAGDAGTNWISLFNGKDLGGWTVHGKATWSVQESVLVGVGGMGHIYTDTTCSDFESWAGNNMPARMADDCNDNEPFYEPEYSGSAARSGAKSCRILRSLNCGCGY